MALIFDLFDPIFDLKIVLLEQIGLVAWASRIVLADQNVCCGSDHSLGVDRSRGVWCRIDARVWTDRFNKKDRSFIPDRSYGLIGI